ASNDTAMLPRGSYANCFVHRATTMGRPVERERLNRRPRLKPPLLILFLCRDSDETVDPVQVVQSRRGRVPRSRTPALVTLLAGKGSATSRSDRGSRRLTHRP